MKRDFQIVSLLLHAVTISLIDETRQVLAVDYPIKSPTKVNDPDGSDLGPVTELSSSVLQTDELLHYICRKNGDAENNYLSKKISGGDVERLPGSVESELCGTDQNDPYYRCIISTGSVKWERDYGGRYFCAAYPDEAFNIHWINPVTQVPNSVDLEADRYGSTLTFYCAVEMTPVDISYEGTLTIEWDRKSVYTGRSWTQVVDGDDVSIYMANRGPNSTLEIKNYNAIRHGGDYQCRPKVTGFGNVNNIGTFTIKSKPSAKITNNLRDEFDFGLYEKITFRCEAQSYPVPETLEFKLDGTVVDLNTPGVIDKEDQVGRVDIDKDFVEFTVRNASETFRNGSVLQCIVKRSGGGETHDVQSIILLPKPPPTRAPTTLPTNGKGAGQTQGELSPGIVAAAVIIPLLVILAIIAIVVYRYLRRSRNNTVYYPPTNNLNRGHYNTPRLTQLTNYDSRSRSSLRSQGVNSQYGRVDQNPLYSSQYGKARSVGQRSDSRSTGKADGIYSEPNYKQVPGSVRRQESPGYAPGSMSRRPSPGYAPGSMSRSGSVGYAPGSLRGQKSPRSTPGSMRRQDSSGYAPGSMRIHENPGYALGSVHRQETVGYAPGSMIGQESPGYAPSSVRRQENPGYASGSMSKMESPGYAPSYVHRQENPGYAPSSVRRQESPGYAPSSVRRQENPGYAPSSVGRRENPGYAPSSVRRQENPGYAPGSMSKMESPGYAPGSLRGQKSPGSTPGSMQRLENPGYGSSSVQEYPGYAPGSMSRQETPGYAPESPHSQEHSGSTSGSIDRQENSLYDPDTTYTHESADYDD